MDICCGEVVVKSQIKNQSKTPSDIVPGSLQNESENTPQTGSHQLSEDMVLLQNQINDLSTVIAQLPIQIGDELKEFVKQKIKDEQHIKRF